MFRGGGDEGGGETRSARTGGVEGVGLTRGLRTGRSMISGSGGRAAGAVGATEELGCGVNRAGVSLSRAASIPTSRG